MSDVDRKLAEVAAAQHCLFTLDDVIACGGTNQLATRRVVASHWERGRA